MIIFLIIFSLFQMIAFSIILYFLYKKIVETNNRFPYFSDIISDNVLNVEYAMAMFNDIEYKALNAVASNTTLHKKIGELNDKIFNMQQLLKVKQEVKQIIKKKETGPVKIIKSITNKRIYKKKK